MKNTRIIEEALLPLLQSAISGFLLAICTLVGIFTGKELGMNGEVFDIPIMMSLFMFVSGTMFFWFIYTGNHKQRLDKVYGLDTKSASKPEKPMKQESTIHLNIYGDSGGNFLSLNCTNEQLIAFAKGIVAGKAFTTRSWAYGHNSVFSPREFESLRDELISKGYARWKDGDGHHRGGAVITKKGMAVINYLATQLPYPTGAGLLVKRANIR